MTISKDNTYKNFIVDCDKCSYSENLDADDFYEAVQEVKDKGWQLRKDASGHPSQPDWIHVCPDCQPGR